MAKTTEAAAVTAPAFVDLGSLDANLRLQEDGIAVQIMGPDNKPLGLVITICGPDSSRAEKAVKELQKEVEKEAAKEGSVEEDTAEAQKRRSIAYLAKVTTGWNVPVRIDGQDLPFSEENAKKVYSRYPIIKGQVEFKAERRSAFIEG